MGWILRKMALEIPMFLAAMQPRTSNDTPTEPAEAKKPVERISEIQLIEALK